MTFREVLIRRGIRFRTRMNNEVAICCLFCPERGETPDLRYRLCVNVASGAGICFNCNWRSRHAMQQIMRRLNVLVDVDTELPGLASDTVVRLPSDFQSLTRIHSDLDRMAVRYLHKRGITTEQIRDKRIGVSFVGRYAYRVMFPIYNGKQLSGFVARDFTGQQEPKYLNSLGHRSLYNVGDQCSAGCAYLSEGVFKALRIEQLGLRSWAILGREASDLQLEQIEQTKCKEIVLWPDPDKAGRQGAVAMAEKLVQIGILVGVVWPVYQPPDEEPLCGMRQTLQRVEGYSWYLRQRLLLGPK